MGNPSTLHLWWARRPLAAARAVIFTSLVDDPDDANAPVLATLYIRAKNWILNLVLDSANRQLTAKLGG